MRGGGGIIGGGGRFDQIYRSYPTYSERQFWANSEDPDQTSHNAVSDQGLYCSPNSQQFYIHKF